MGGTKVKLERLSLCKCGFPLLNESIKLGTEYTIWPMATGPVFEWICGGCRKVNRQEVCVLASQVLHPNLPPAYLPAVLFRPVKRTGQDAEPEQED
jgi:hypothetical protein